jgi:NAD-dependent dihydropyrimidine dehydrogenase PreA subunit
MKICLCACQYYHRISPEKIAAVQAVCRAAQIPCEIVPDLCLTAIQEPTKLDAYDTVLACQFRAVRSLVGEKANCIDLRSTPLADILTALSLPMVESPLEPVYEKVDSDWIPWFPVIDSARCVQCKKCVDFCLFGVYSIEEDKVRVTQPQCCKTDCPACARICPQNAIMFPKSDEDRLNGTLTEPITPSESDKMSFRERLRHRKGPRLFKEDEL